MANTLYDKGRQRFLEAQLNWLTDTIKCILVNTGSYTANFTVHEFLSDVPTSSRVGTTSGITLTSKTTGGGAADAADITFSSVSGNTVHALILFKDTGTEATSPLIGYIDTATGLPITPNGGDIITTWDNGPNRIFKL